MKVPTRDKGWELVEDSELRIAIWVAVGIAFLVEFFLRQLCCGWREREEALFRMILITRDVRAFSLGAFFGAAFLDTLLAGTSSLVSRACQEPQAFACGPQMRMNVPHGCWMGVLLEWDVVV